MIFPLKPWFSEGWTFGIHQALAAMVKKMSPLFCSVAPWLSKVQIAKSFQSSFFGLSRLQQINMFHSQFFRDKSKSWVHLSLNLWIRQMHLMVKSSIGWSIHRSRPPTALFFCSLEIAPKRDPTAPEGIWQCDSACSSVCCACIGRTPRFENSRPVPPNCGHVTGKLVLSHAPRYLKPQQMWTETANLSLFVYKRVHVSLDV